MQNIHFLSYPLFVVSFRLLIPLPTSPFGLGLHLSPTANTKQHAPITKQTNQRKIHGGKQVNSWGFLVVAYGCMRVQLLNHFHFTSRRSSSVDSLALTSSMPPSSSSWSIACTSSGHERRNNPDDTLYPHGSNANACGNPCRQGGDTPTDVPALCRSWRSSMQRRSPSVA